MFYFRVLAMETGIMIRLENSLQSMHWAVRNKKEPMLEAAKAETPITSNAEDLYCQQEAPGIVSSEAMQSSSNSFSFNHIHIMCIIIKVPYYFEVT